MRVVKLDVENQHEARQDILVFAQTVAKQRDRAGGLADGRAREASSFITGRRWPQQAAAPTEIGKSSVLAASVPPAGAELIPSDRGRK
jgi:hypothetical protein